MYLKKCQMTCTLVMYWGMIHAKKAITKAVYDVNNRTNAILSLFAHASSDNRYFLYKSPCMSLYGSQLWDYCGNDINKLYTTWRKCVRKLFRLSPRTHSRLLHYICLDLPPDTQLHKRFLKFCHTALRSNNSCLKMCANMTLMGSASTFCQSYNLICDKYNIARYSILSNSLNHIIQHTSVHNTDSTDERISNFIRDLIHTRDNCETKITSIEAQEMLDYICICKMSPWYFPNCIYTTEYTTVITF